MEKSYYVINSFEFGKRTITITTLLEGADAEERANRLMAAHRKTAEKYQLKNSKIWTEPATHQNCLMK